MQIHDLDTVEKYIARVSKYVCEGDIKLTATGFKGFAPNDGGYPIEVAKAAFDLSTGQVNVYGRRAADFAPTDDERNAIKFEIDRITKDEKWDQPFPLRSLDDANPLPEDFETVRRTKGDWFWEYKEKAKDGNLIQMVEIRQEDKNGEKFYRQATYWETDKGECVWREVQPDKLPIYNGHLIDGKQCVFYLVEGPKSADFLNRIISPKTAEDREFAASWPWTDWFVQNRGVAVAFGGGANRVDATDFSPLNKEGNSIFTISDRDLVGERAVSQISRKLRKANVYRVTFDGRFTGGWDVCDAMPDNFFEKQEDGSTKFIGPNFENFVTFGAWLTTIEAKDEHGKVTAWKLTPQAEAELVYVASLDRFTTRSRPWQMFEFQGFNRTFASTSDCNIAPLVINNSNCVFDTTDYLPGCSRSIMRDGQKVLNLWANSRIKPVAPLGATIPNEHVAPFLDLLSAILPIDAERTVVERWLATVIGKPERRVTFAILMASEMTGIGKTTIAERILKPLLGGWNVSFAKRTDVEGQFNGWLANKRLVVISELYASTSLKFLSQLKEYVTDETVRFNEKNLKAQEITNAAHFFMTSNSMNALMIDSPNERRVFVPTMTDTRPAPEVFQRLFHWLHAEEGLGKILWWAQNHPDHFASGAKAPDSERKREMLQDSRSKAEARLIDQAEAIAESDKPMVIGSKDALEWASSIARHHDERFWMKETNIRKALRGAKLIDLDDIVSQKQGAPADKRWLPVTVENGATGQKTFAGKQYAIANKTAVEKLKEANSFDDLKKMAREFYKPIASIGIAA
jgi:hypothetical protein